MEFERSEWDFSIPLICDNLISDAEIGLDFPITHHDISVMKLADL